MQSLVRDRHGDPAHVGQPATGADLQQPGERVRLAAERRHDGDGGVPGAGIAGAQRTQATQDCRRHGPV